MLVLSRQRDESIMIGDNIVVTIVDIRGDKVRLGINAPTEIPVHRQEVYEAIQRENVPRQSPRTQRHTWLGQTCPGSRPTHKGRLTPPHGGRRWTVRGHKSGPGRMTGGLGTVVGARRRRTKNFCVQIT